MSIDFILLKERNLNMKPQNSYLYMLIFALLFCDGTANANMQSGICKLTKYYLHNGEKKQTTLIIWWESSYNIDQNTKKLIFNEKAISVFGETDETPTLYKLIGLQDRGIVLPQNGYKASDRSDWSIKKVDMENDTDDRWQVTAYGFKQDIASCTLTNSQLHKAILQDTSVKIFQSKFQNGEIKLSDQPSEDTPGIPKSTSFYLPNIRQHK
jgi:hypothetical protein